MGIFTRVLCESLYLHHRIRVIDVGCGSGIVGIYALLEGSAGVLFNDIQAEALRCVRHNLTLNGLVSGWSLHCGPFADLRLDDVTAYDLIAFDPPQFPLGLGVRAFPPSEAVFRSGGADGLDVVCQFLDWYQGLGSRSPVAMLVLSSILGEERIYTEVIDRRALRLSVIHRCLLPLRNALVEALRRLSAGDLPRLGVSSGLDGVWYKQLIVAQIRHPECGRSSGLRADGRGVSRVGESPRR
jgi:methylase of polypeptide subunit release factors